MTTHNIFISGDIVAFNYNEDNEYSIRSLTNDLKALSVKENDTLIVDINTFGGDTETGFAMYNQLLRFKNENKISLTTRVTGYCASIGSVILLAGDKRIGNKFNTPFVHNAWCFAYGDSNQMQKISEDLEKTNDKIASLYAEKTNIDFQTAKNLMNESAYIDSEKILEYGFYTEIENQNILNSINYKQKEKMNTNEKINQIWNKIFKSKNKIVFTAENKELDFYELQDGDPIIVGVKANVDEQPANGEIIMSTGETYIFESGILTEIKEVVADVEIANLKAEIEVLKTENNNLKETQNFLNQEIEKFKEFKNQVLNIKNDAPIIEVTPTPNVANSTKEEKTRTFNLNPKKNK